MTKLTLKVKCTTAAAWAFVEGVNINKIPKNAISTPIPVSDAEKETVQVAYGEYKIIAQYGDDFDGNLPNGLGKVVWCKWRTRAWFCC